MSDLISMPATAVVEGLKAGQISSLDCLDALEARITTVNSRINALPTLCFDRARDEARAAERAVLDGKPLGLLHGLPLGVKDLEATAGLLTTYGSPLYRDNVPAEDNVLVARLRASARAAAINEQRME